MSWCGISGNRNRYLATLQKHFQYFAHVTIFPVMPSEPGFNVCVCTVSSAHCLVSAPAPFFLLWGSYSYLRAPVKFRAPRAGSSPPPHNKRKGAGAETTRIARAARKIRRSEMQVRSYYRPWDLLTALLCVCCWKATTVEGESHEFCRAARI